MFNSLDGVGYRPTQCNKDASMFLFLKKETIASIDSRSEPAVEKMTGLFVRAIFSISGQSANEQLAIFM